MKENYPAVFALLGVEEMQLSEEGTFFNKDLLATLNSAIEAKNKETADAKALAEQLTSEKNELTAQIETLNADHQKAINDIVHPAVFRDFEESGMLFMESAIMYESGIYKLVDRVLAVVAPKEVRIQRVMARDNISREKVLEWMDRQMPQKELIHKADYVIVNDGQAEIDKQLKKIIVQCNKPF